MANETIMLAKPSAKAFKHIEPTEIYHVSEKLDGQPMFIDMSAENPVALSRQGKEITSVQHIIDSLKESNVTGIVVGELYIHGKGSAEISGKVRKNELCTDLILYVFPEFFNASMESESVRPIHREYMSGMQLARTLDSEGNLTKEGFDHLYDAVPLTTSTYDTFEGFIARKVTSLWEAGKRSNDYIKLLLEPTIDLRVVGFVEAESKDGEPLGRVGAFVCEWGEGTCEVGAGKLTHEGAEHVWNNIADYLDKVIEVKYKQDSKYSKPRQPTFQRIREDKETYQTSF